jgi:hypothetical protein
MVHLLAILALALACVLWYLVSAWARRHGARGLQRGCGTCAERGGCAGPEGLADGGCTKAPPPSGASGTSGAR